MPKDILFSDTARERLFSGVIKLNNAVKITLGAAGRNAIFGARGRSAIVSNDGVTITREVELKDEFENMGAKLVREAAEKTNDTAGDGTTSSIVLAHAIIEEGMKHLQEGANAVELKEGILKATKAIVAELEKIAIPITTKKQKQQIAAVSAQSEEIGNIVADVLEKVGENGIVTVEEGQTTDLEVEVVEGMRFLNGFISPYMMTNTQKLKAEYEDPYILITDKKITSMQEELLPLFEKLMQAGQKRVVIIAEDVAGDALSLLVVNKLRGGFSTLAVKAPGRADLQKELLEDLAAITGAKVISEDVGLKLENTEIADLGRAGKVIADKDHTTIVDGKGGDERIKKRVDEIETQLKAEDISDGKKEELELRLAKLTAGVGVIKVGAATEVEQREKLHRVEDAVEATKAAIEEGIVAGGGAALIHASRNTPPNPLFSKSAGSIMLKAVEMPLRQIAENAGLDGVKILAEIEKQDSPNMGFDINTGEPLDLIEAGIIDPKKVVRSALENAASVAGIFLTTEAAIAEEPEEKKDEEKK